MAVSEDKDVDHATTPCSKLASTRTRHEREADPGRITLRPTRRTRSFTIAARTAEPRATSGNDEVELRLVPGRPPPSTSSGRSPTASSRSSPSAAGRGEMKLSSWSSSAWSTDGVAKALSCTSAHGELVALRHGQRLSARQRRAAPGRARLTMTAAPPIAAHGSTSKSASSLARRQVVWRPRPARGPRTQGRRSARPGRR